MSCKYCGAPIVEGEKFCRNCGNAIPVTETVEVETVSEPESVETTDTYEDSYENYYESSEEDSYEQPQFENYDNQTSGGGSGLAIASMVLGILSVVCCCLSFITVILGIAAVVCGVISIVKGYNGKGMAIAGIVTGGLGLLIGIISFVGAISSVADIMKNMPEGTGLEEITEMLENYEL